MAGARQSLSPTSHLLISEILESPRSPVIPMADATKTAEISPGHELEDGEIIDEIDLQNLAIETVDVDAGKDDPTADLDIRASFFRTFSLCEPRDEPDAPLSGMPNAGSSMARDVTDGTLESPSSSLAMSPVVHAVDVNSEAQIPHVDMPPLSPKEYELAKDAVLDLLGWGVEPEYLVECGISSHAIYRIFTDLHLRLPSNLSYFQSV
ncbi:hypothetical protein H0H92_005905 [Tricholoma furcatifolium]|nr:hypothetical protein H0H92_005905 [Tricholoma furcatifolium]